jgi:hypothetical protein
VDGAKLIAQLLLGKLSSNIDDEVKLMEIAASSMQIFKL